MNINLLFLLPHYRVHDLIHYFTKQFDVNSRNITNYTFTTAKSSTGKYYLKVIFSMRDLPYYYYPHWVECFKKSVEKKYKTVKFSGYLIFES